MIMCKEKDNGSGRIHLDGISGRFMASHVMYKKPLVLKANDLTMPLTVSNVRRLVMVADRLLEGRTREEASKDYPTEDDYWKAVVDEYIRSCLGNR